MIAMKQAAVFTGPSGVRLYDSGISVCGVPVLTLDPDEARAYDDGATPPPGFTVEPVLYRVPGRLTVRQ